MAEGKKIFRCPYEDLALREGRMIRIQLSENEEERMQQLRDGFKAFYADKNKLALSFTLPKELRERCSSNRELKSAILPYQSEVVATELELRLYPFWPHQMTQFPPGAIRKRLELGLQDDVVNVQLVAKLCEMMGGKKRHPRSAADIAHWLTSKHTSLRKRQGLDTIIRIPLQDTHGEEHTMLHLAPHNAIFQMYQEYEDDAPKNRNCFGIVRSPFFPESFGRHSPDIEMVFTRETDFALLPEGVRHKIVTDSNTVLREGGIRIGNLSVDKQRGGVWAHEIEPSHSEYTREGFLKRGE